MSAVPTIRADTRELFQGIGLSEVYAKDLEIGIYNTMIDYATEHGIPLSWASDVFVQGYLGKARSLYANLHKQSYIANPHLLHRVLSGEFPPHELASMPPDRLFPEQWEDLIHREILRNEEAYEFKEVPKTSMVTCGKCKGNKITYVEMQLRSGDEGMTMLYKCITCGHRWKH